MMMMMMVVPTSGVGVDDEMTFRVLSFFLCAGETMPIDPKKINSLNPLLRQRTFSLRHRRVFLQAAVVCLLLLRDAPTARAPFCVVVVIKTRFFKEDDDDKKTENDDDRMKTVVVFCVAFFSAF